MEICINVINDTSIKTVAIKFHTKKAWMMTWIESCFLSMKFLHNC